MTEPLDKLDQAIRWAVSLHSGQTDKLGKPYILHPLAVMLGVERRGGSSEAMQAAVLHDVIEDCDVTEATVAMYHGLEVARVVRVVSNLDKLPYPEFIEQIIHAGGDAPLVKLCDVENNLEFCRRAARAGGTRARLLGKYVPAKARLLQHLGLQ